MDNTFRRRLIAALKSRSWTTLDAERAAAIIAGLYEEAEGDEDGKQEWKAWLSTIAGESDLYRVARDANQVSVFDSPLGRPARDVASALNDLEGQDPEPTDTR